MVVSSGPPPPKQTPLSYADHAKKVQSLKPLVAPQIQRPFSQSSTSSSFVPTLPKPSSTIDLKLPPQSNSEASGSGKTPVVPSYLMPGHINGDHKLSPPSPQKPTSTNVWDIRKEQLAAHTHTPNTPATSTQTLNHPPVSASATSSGLSKDDPFLLQIPAQPSPTERNDETNWPEVGKSASSSAGISHIHTPESNEVQEHRESPGHPPHKKNERSKWVQIPPEELQAAADAMNASQRRTHSRNISQHSNRPSYPHYSNAASGSGKNSASHSVTQSRVHSRTPSVQSSPRPLRGRLLGPEEGMGPPTMPGDPLRTSQPHNPAAAPHPAYFNEPNNNSYPYGQPHNFVNYYPPPRHLHPPPSAMAYSHSSQSPLGYGPPAHFIPPEIAPHPMSPNSVGYQPPPFSAYPGHPPFEYNSATRPHTYWGAHGQLGAPMPPPHYPQPPPPPSDSSLPDTNSHFQPFPPARPPPPEESQAVASYRPLDLAGDQPVLFGTIGAPLPAQSPSLTAHDRVHSITRSFTTFSIGVDSSDEKLRNRNILHSANAQSHVNGPIDVSNPIVTAEPKWEFGTTSHVTGPILIVESANEIEPNSIHSKDPVDILSASSLAVAFNPTSTSAQSGLRPEPSLLTQAFPGQRSGASLSPLDLETSNRASIEGNGGEWHVQNFGYGFGEANGTNVPRDNSSLRDPARPDDLYKDGKDRDTHRPREDMRPRRPSYNGGFYEREGFNGRRGRGYNRGGRGFRYNQHGRPPHFNSTPPPHFQNLSSAHDGYYHPHHSPLTTYIPTGFEQFPIPPIRQAPPTGTQNLPVPVPVTALSFPLDHTRYYLLGQLEYYLSPQNLAQDFFLRQQMDSRGWIPISVIAAFNRVTSLTSDVQLVRDVLTLSSIAQVMGDVVRMNGWESFVLPDATPSIIEGIFDPSGNHLEGEADAEDEEEEDVEFVL